MSEHDKHREPYWHPPIISVGPVIINTPIYSPPDIGKLLDADPRLGRRILDILREHISSPPLDFGSKEG